ncbi:MAG: hypothetical protein KF860_00745 [Cyclobacteriaceae bacterium]|nr:hypothetical protein [Cyclobacteriaceae bacterium]
MEEQKMITNAEKRWLVRELFLRSVSVSGLCEIKFSYLQSPFRERIKRTTITILAGWKTCHC